MGISPPKRSLDIIVGKFKAGSGGQDGGALKSRLMPHGGDSLPFSSGLHLEPLAAASEGAALTFNISRLSATTEGAASNSALSRGSRSASLTHTHAQRKQGEQLTPFNLHTLPTCTVAYTLTNLP